MPSLRTATYRDRLAAFRADARGFTGAEKALLITFALAIVLLVGSRILGGSQAAGGDAKRVLEQGTGALAAMQRGIGVDSVPHAMDEGGPEGAPAPLQKAGALQRTGAGTVGPSPRAAVAPPGPREQYLGQVRDWLNARYTEAQALQGDARIERIEGILNELASVNQQIKSGRYPEIAKLDTAPHEATTPPAASYLPPELIGSARKFINVLDQNVPGATRVKDPQIEGSLYRADEDWNARLGVPHYRSQLTNLAAPEATCNVTSTSMILERLGYDRKDVMAAIDRELKARYLRQIGRDPAKEDLSQVTLPADFFQRQVKQYLDHQNDDSSYRRLRGTGTTDKQRQQIAGEYRDGARMQDALDFLLYLKGISRYEAATQASTILKYLQPNADLRPTAENLSPSAKYRWTDARADIQSALDNGGGAMLSIYHKGAGQSGTHLITIQRLTPTGAIVDDPYGHIRSDYNRNQVGDAYADPGRTRSTSSYRNAEYSGYDERWKVSAPPDAGETRGDSVEIPNEVLGRMWNRVTIYKRPGAGAGP